MSRICIKFDVVLAIRSCGLLTSYLNIPHMSYLSSDVTVRDKTQYTTLVRPFFDQTTLGRCFMFTA